MCGCVNNLCNYHDAELLGKRFVQLRFVQHHISIETLLHASCAYG